MTCAGPGTEKRPRLQNNSKFIFLPLEFPLNQIIFTDIYHFLTDIIGDRYDFGNEKRQSEKIADT